MVALHSTTPSRRWGGDLNGLEREQRLLPLTFVVIADNIQAQTDRFCLLNPVPTGSGPFFYWLGVK